MDKTITEAFSELVADTRALLVSEGARGVLGFPEKSTVQVSDAFFNCGPPKASLLVVGEFDGGQSREGLPNGPAGEMLAKMIQHVLGLEPADVHFLNVFRLSKPAAIPGYLEFLSQTVGSVQPRLILSLGQSALWANKGPDANLTAARGKWTELMALPFLSTFHPSFLLENDEFKRLAFRDLKDVKRLLEGGVDS
jgi:uracil-DNA glycosylase family 4